MQISNYEITRNKMRTEFLNYPQDKMIRKFHLENNEDYIYIEFLRRSYRIGRRTGIIEWSDDGFKTVNEAEFNDSMTIYDVLCYSKENCSLSGRFCSVNLLKGILQTGGPTGNLFQSSAEAFKGKTDELRNACSILGDPANLSGDISALIYAFTFLPIIIQYWEEDDEFPASLKFMFDENILQYMHYETVFYLMGSAIHRLKELSQHVQ